MGRNNPSNPYSNDKSRTQRRVQRPIKKARVMDAGEHPYGNGFHVIRIKIYGEDGTHLAPVIAPMHGSVWVPKIGQDVAVMHGPSDKPWVMGSWYATDRIESGDVTLPNYVPGDIRIGNDSGSHATVHNDGHISVITDGNERLDTDHHSAKTSLTTDSATGSYSKITWDEVDYNDEGMFDKSNNEFNILADGEHHIEASYSVSSGGYNQTTIATDANDGDDNDIVTAWLYSIAIYKNGSLYDESHRHSVADKPITVDISILDDFNEGDTLDMRVKQDSGSDKAVDNATFSIRREGI